VGCGAVIGYLEGTLFRKQPDRVLVLTGGVGYQVSVSFQTFCGLPDAGQAVKLEIHHHVKEDRSELYGFLDMREKALFEKLIGVSGIGPKSALGILSPHPAAEVAAAIEAENISFLTKIPGIGKKTAQRVVLELKGKLDGAVASETVPVPVASLAVRDDALGVLVNLGYKQTQVEKVLDSILGEQPTDDFEDLLKRAFERLSGV